MSGAFILSARILTDIAEEQSPSSAKSVVGVRGERETGNTTDRLDGVEDTEQRASGSVEVFLPVLDSLET